jgi:hypothetical protein
MINQVTIALRCVEFSITLLSVIPSALCLDCQIAVHARPCYHSRKISRVLWLVRYVLLSCSLQVLKLRRVVWYLHITPVCTSQRNAREPFSTRATSRDQNFVIGLGRKAREDHTLHFTYTSLFQPNASSIAIPRISRLCLFLCVRYGSLTCAFCTRNIFSTNALSTTCLHEADSDWHLLFWH